MLWLYRNFKRKRLSRRPFPEAWRVIVERRLGFARALTGEERARFLTHLKVFAWEKYFIGAGGQVIDDEIRVVISGAAARIVRNLPLDVYDRLTEIVVYPSHYKHPGNDHTVVYGEAHRWGTVVLSWDAVLHGLVRDDDGHDTAMHEFAHVLDIVDGAFDGTPELDGGRAAYQRWARVFTDGFHQLRARPERNALRPYGATNEAEFFAVATETFFERPELLARTQPELYETLSAYYRLDPAAARVEARQTDNEQRRQRRRGRRRRRG